MEGNSHKNQHKERVFMGFISSIAVNCCHYQVEFWIYCFKIPLSRSNRSFMWVTCEDKAQSFHVRLLLMLLLMVEIKTFTLLKDLTTKTYNKLLSTNYEYLLHEMFCVIYGKLNLFFIFGNDVAQSISRMSQVA